MGGKVLAFEPWNEADGSGVRRPYRRPKWLRCRRRPIWASRRAIRTSSPVRMFSPTHPGHPGRFPRQPGLALLRHLQLASLRGGQPISRASMPRSARSRRTADVGHRVQPAGELVGRRKRPRNLPIPISAFRPSGSAGLRRFVARRRAAAFYFILPHYVEQQTQFGLIRSDLTPRPAYVALAAVGRFLADARPLGRLQAEQTGPFMPISIPRRPDGAETIGPRGLGRSQSARVAAADATAGDV